MNEFTSIQVPRYIFPPLELVGIFKPLEWNEFLRDLRKVERECGQNKNDRVTVLAAMCIDKKIDTMGLIIRVLGLLGYDRGHVAIIVKKWNGRHPDRHLWFVDGAGKYHSLPNTIFAAA